jgi:CRISPR/Cas system CSM-associated protein Csm3 (group 7 of RAMP superfamily)
MINLESIPQHTESLTLTAIIDTALCVGAGGSSGSLADKAIVRTADGKLLIPASQVKGRLRHECEKLARSLGWPICHSPKPNTMCPQRVGLNEEENAEFDLRDYQVPGMEGKHCLICQIFGNPKLESRIDVDDFVCPIPAEELPEVLRPGVTINRRRQTAEDRKLYFLETSPVNLQLEFQGAIHLYSNLPTQAQPLIRGALAHIHALGGSKSTGLGWLTWDNSHWSSISQSDWQTLIPGGLQ